MTLTPQQAAEVRYINQVFDLGKDMPTNPPSAMIVVVSERMATILENLRKIPDANDRAKYVIQEAETFINGMMMITMMIFSPDERKAIKSVLEAAMEKKS